MEEDSMVSGSKIMLVFPARTDVKGKVQFDLEHRFAWCCGQQSIV